MDSEMSKYNVFLRIKPLNVQSVDDQINEEMLTVGDSAVTTRHVNKKNETVYCNYNFKKVFKPSAPQVEVFDEIVCPRLHDFFCGNDSLIFSYGASNSGKSFTMQGTPSEPGIIPRVLHTIFYNIEGHLDTECPMAPYMSCQATVLTERDIKNHRTEKSTVLEGLHESHTETLNASLSGTSSSQLTMVLDESPIIPSCLDSNVLCSVWISFYEIYNENIYDLLAVNQVSLQNPLKLGYDKEDGSYHPLNLREVNATSWDEAFSFYRYGKKNLRVAETLLNRKSSRSHCVFTVKLLTRLENETDQFIGVKSFILCDLAGSERMSHTDAKGKSTVREMLNINSSLLTLNKCFVLLKGDGNKVNKTNDPPILPYRDSKLTMLFKRFLLGQGKLSMIANISQEADLYYQTEQVLRMTSLAYNTRVESKRTEKLAFKLPQVMPRKRFSIMIGHEQNSPVSGLIPSNHQQHLILNSGSQYSRQEIERLKRENATLAEQIRIKDSEMKLLNEKQDYYLETARATEEELKSQILHLENRLNTQETQVSFFHSKTYELETKYRKRVEEANQKELDYHLRLTAERNKLDDLMTTLKNAFSVAESTGPQATVQQVIYLYNETISAATEEVSEYEQLIEDYKEEVNALQKLISEKDDEIANLKGRLMELEEMRELEDARMSSIRKRVETVEADDENTASPFDSDSDCFLSNPRIKSHGKAKWVSDDENSPLYLPPKAKTTTKKKKKKVKKTSDVPFHGSCVKSQESSSHDTLTTVRRARRQLLGKEPDYLGEGLLLDRTLPDTQMSPGSIMKKTLRSGKRLL